MSAQARNLIASGIEPVDELLGGLESGQLYLVHGETTGTSLFGIKFLIEGLKRNENCALVIRYSPEDAVRRFARLGYDCLEDVYSGRLVILEYSDDIIQKIGKLRELTPVLRELDWLLGETRPKRLLFDPVTSVLTGTAGSIEARAKEFSEWARLFGGTVVLTTDESNQEVVQSFNTHVAGSFRFDLRYLEGATASFIAFEKSPTIPDQAVEVDPSRGVFLLSRSTEGILPHPPSIAELESIREELRSAREAAQIPDTGSLDAAGRVEPGTSRIGPAPDTGELISEAPLRDNLQTRRLTSVEALEPQPGTRAKADSTGLVELDLPFDEPPREAAPLLAEGPLDELSDLLDDVTGSATPLDLNLPELTGEISSEPTGEILIEERKEELAAGSPEQPPAGASPQPSSVPRVVESTERRVTGHGRAADLRIDSALAARAAELLLRPPDSIAEPPGPQAVSVRREEQREHARPGGEGEVQARDFSVLIIEDDPETSELVNQTLGEFTLEAVHDGVSGLAKLISFKPDLVILDFDLPVIDGFKVLTLIRASLNVPVIMLSSSRMRAIDRVMAAELGADYFLTKPFSAKELKQKARQLIARYRGISSWIITAPSGFDSRRTDPDPEEAASAERAAPERFVPYREFAADVESRVKETMDGGAPFSIVGCRLPRMTANGGRGALRLFDIVRALIRESDVMSTNSRNDLVVLLADAGKTGARAFAGRLRERVREELSQEPSLWTRSFPEPQDSVEGSMPAATGEESGFNRRASDRPGVPKARAGH